MHARHERVSRRGVLAIGGAAAAGAAAALLTSGTLHGVEGERAAQSDRPTPAEADGPWRSVLTIPVDQLGGSDDERIGVLNERAKRSAAKDTPVYEFAHRTYTLSTPIQLYSGLKLVGSGGLPAREFGSGTTIRWRGEPDSSIFTFPPEGQTRQGYPADGSPRDISISGILFEGRGQTDVLPRLSMSADSYRGQTLYYCNLHNLGVRAMRTFWWGYGTGTSLTGSFHAQAMSETPLFLGGSENTIFGSEAQSFMDNSSAAWVSSGKPFIRTVMEKSYIGRVIITARSDSYHLSVEGGGSLIVSGVQFDAPSSFPSYGSALKVSAVDGLTISNCVFHANMANPGDGSRGVVDISGGRNVVVYGNQFVAGRPQDREGPGSETPIVFCSSPDTVKIGLNGYPGYAGMVKGNAVSSDPGLKLLPA